MADGEFEGGWNLTLFLFVGITFIGLLWLYASGVEAATFYLFLLLASFSILFSLLFFLKRTEWTKFLIIPLERNTFQGNYNFLIGVSLFLVANLFKRQLMPESVIFSQKFFQVLPQGSFAVFFTKVWVASIVEDLFFGFLMVVIGAVIGYYILKSLNITNRPTLTKYFPLIIGFVVSGVLFTLFHTFNPTYTTTSAFAIALIFRTVVNVIIWSTASLMFGIGAHFGNNLLAIGYAQFGFAILTLSGLFIGALLLIMIWSVIIGFRQHKINPFLTSKSAVSG